MDFQYIYRYIYIAGVFGSSSHVFFGVWFFYGFGCDCGLWLKWQFGGCVGGGLVAVVVVVVDCVGGCGRVGGGLICFFFLAVGYGCHKEVVVGGVVDVAH